MCALGRSKTTNKKALPLSAGAVAEAIPTGDSITTTTSNKVGDNMSKTTENLANKSKLTASDNYQG